MIDRTKLSRRDALRLAVLGILGTLVAACQRAVQPIVDVMTPTPAPTKILLSASDANKIPVSSNKEFFSYSFSTVFMIPKDWTFAITGLVAKPLTLSMADIKALPSVTEMQTLACISNTVGGELIANAVWKGVRVRDVLTRAGVKPTAHFLKIESFDGFTTGIPLELGMHDHSLLVYEMNGEPLPLDHGAPLRCLFPGRFGMKQPKWIQTITLIEKEYAGFWEKQGWSFEAPVLPYSRIDDPTDLSVITGSTFSMSGIAHAGESGLAKLEIGWDDLTQWETADLIRGPNPYVWCVWKWTGKSLSPGRHKLYARATDGNGKAQTRGIGYSMIGDTFPDGTDHMHSVVLEFKG